MGWPLTVLLGVFIAWLLILVIRRGTSYFNEGLDKRIEIAPPPGIEAPPPMEAVAPPPMESLESAMVSQEPPFKRVPIEDTDSLLVAVGLVAKEVPSVMDGAAPGSMAKWIKDHPYQQPAPGPGEPAAAKEKDQGEIMGGAAPPPSGVWMGGMAPVDQTSGVMTAAGPASISLNVAPGTPTPWWMQPPAPPQGAPGPAPPPQAPPPPAPPTQADAMAAWRAQQQAATDAAAAAALQTQIASIANSLIGTYTAWRGSRVDTKVTRTAFKTEKLQNETSNLNTVENRTYNAWVASHGPTSQSDTAYRTQLQIYQTQINNIISALNSDTMTTWINQGAVDPVPATASCAGSGYTYDTSSQMCVTTINPTCDQSGYQFDRHSGTCKKGSDVGNSPVCSVSGYTYDSNMKLCKRIVDATYTCPAATGWTLNTTTKMCSATQS